MAEERNDEQLTLFDLDTNAYEKYTKGDLIARATSDLQNLIIVL